MATIMKYIRSNHVPPVVVNGIPAVAKAPSTTLVHSIPITMPKAVPNDVVMVFRISAVLTFFSLISSSPLLA